jgi:hydroxymethylglutaryl-CoA reductase (NADPH)
MADERTDAIPRRDRYDEDSRATRADWWRARTGASLAPLDPGALRAEEMKGHIENFVGAISVPLGLAGPLRFVGEEASGDVVAPMATTEGALVAATSRGALALTRAGGVSAQVLSRQMIRAPLFGFRDGKTAARFAEWTGRVREPLAAAACEGSRHTRLLDVRPFVIGRDVHLVMTFDTGDAAGQNMVTLATARMTAWIAQALARDATLAPLVPEVMTVEGQMSGDKEPELLQRDHGRGARVSAECVLPRAVVERILRVSPEALARAHHAGTAAALQAGVVGYNANVANVLAALFLATGQDVACVHESAFGILTLDASGGDVYANLLLPSLVVGTVGGGTKLAGPRACLESLGCAGTGKVRRFAEIVAGFAFALELSSYAAMVNGDFAAAHEELGRRG